MTDTTRAVYRIVIDGSMEAIFRELTKRGEPQAAVFNAWLHAQALAPGNAIQMRTGTGKHVLVIGKVLELDPPRRFTHTFRFYAERRSGVRRRLRPEAAAAGRRMHAHRRSHGGRQQDRQGHAGRRHCHPRYAEGGGRNRQACAEDAIDVRDVRGAGIRAARTDQGAELAVAITLLIRGVATMKSAMRFRPWTALLAATALACLSQCAAAAERAIDKDIVVNATRRSGVGGVDDAGGHRQLLRARREDRAARRRRVPDLHRPRSAPPGSKGADDMRFMALQPNEDAVVRLERAAASARGARATHVRRGPLRAR